MITSEAKVPAVSRLGTLKVTQTVLHINPRLSEVFKSGIIFSKLNCLKATVKLKLKQIPIAEIL